LSNAGLNFKDQDGSSVLAHGLWKMYYLNRKR
jgi:hypothetical protein